MNHINPPKQATKEKLIALTRLGPLIIIKTRVGQAYIVQEAKER